METLPDLAYFQCLSDSKKISKEKELFWKSIEKKNWHFVEEMKKYLFNKTQKLMEATVKLTILAHDIQNMLRENYGEKEKFPIGSIFREINQTSFFYNLVVNYVTKSVDLPIYALSFEERGIDSSNCSKMEFVWQHFVRFKRPQSDLHGAYLSPYGSWKFDKFCPDVYDSGVDIYYENCLILSFLSFLGVK